MKNVCGRYEDYVFNTHFDYKKLLMYYLITSIETLIEAIKKPY